MNPGHKLISVCVPGLMWSWLVNCDGKRLKSLMSPGIPWILDPKGKILFIRCPVSIRDKTSIEKENFVKTSKQFLRNLANLRNIVFQPNLYNVVSIVL